METQKTLQQLCDLAVKEQDPNKLLILLQEINRLMDEKEEGVRKNGVGSLVRPED